MADARDHRGGSRGRGGIRLKPGGHRGGGTKFEAHGPQADSPTPDGDGGDEDDGDGFDDVGGMSYGSSFGDARGNRVGHSVPDYIGADDVSAVDVAESIVSPLSAAARDMAAKAKADAVAAINPGPLGIPYWAWGVIALAYLSKRR